MLFAPPFGLLAHGRAMSKDCPHSQTSLFYRITLKKSRGYFRKIPLFCVFPIKIGRPGWNALFFLAAAAVVVAAAVVAAPVAAGVAAAAVAEDQQQNDDPPPVIATVVIAHSRYLRHFLVSILLTLHVMTKGKKGAATELPSPQNFTGFSAHPPGRFCRRSFHPSS